MLKQRAKYCILKITIAIDLIEYHTQIDPQTYKIIRNISRYLIRI